MVVGGLPLAAQASVMAWHWSPVHTPGLPPAPAPPTPKSPPPIPLVLWVALPVVVVVVGWPPTPKWLLLLPAALHETAASPTAERKTPTSRARLFIKDPSPATLH